MTSKTPKFGAWVVASLAGIVGIKYVMGGALALIENSVVSSITVSDTIALSLGCGVLLCVVAGAFVECLNWARPVGLVTFLLVAGLSVPALLAMDPIIVAETVGMGLSVLYLLVRSPFETKATTKVDESDSATRVGSTLR
jgi:hypothetical protein